MVLPYGASARLGGGSLRQPCRRNFSSSFPRRRRGPLVSFPSTSNSEVDAIVTKFRDTAFLPNHLGKAYRDMVYRPKMQYYLTGEEPVTVSLPLRPAVPGQVLPNPKKKAKVEQEKKNDGKKESKVLRATAPHVHPQKKPFLARGTFTLAPLQINTDIPRTRPNFTKMLQLMAAPSDFSILPAFLHELRVARLPVTPQMLAKTVRRSAELGRVDVVIQMFQNVHSLGIALNHPEVVTQTLIAIVRHASAGYWAEEQLDEALSYVDKVLIMLRDPRHRVEENGEPAPDARDGPHVWGVAMALEAVRHLRYGPREPGPHHSHSLSTLTEAFVTRLDTATLAEPPSGWQASNQWLAAWAPVVLGIKYAIQALGPKTPLAMKLEIALSPMQAAIAKAANAVEQTTGAERPRIGLQMLRDMDVALEVEAPPVAAAEEPAIVTSDEIVAGEEDVDVEAERPNAKSP